MLQGWGWGLSLLHGVEDCIINRMWQTTHQQSKHQSKDGFEAEVVSHQCGCQVEAGTASGLIFTATFNEFKILPVSQMKVQRLGGEDLTQSDTDTKITLSAVVSMIAALQKLGQDDCQFEGNLSYHPQEYGPHPRGRSLSVAWSSLTKLGLLASKLRRCPCLRHSPLLES